MVNFTRRNQLGAMLTIDDDIFKQTNKTTVVLYPLITDGF